MPSISSDGRFVAFESNANNLALNDTNNAKDIFVHDIATGQTELISRDSLGVQGNAAALLKPPFQQTDDMSHSLLFRVTWFPMIRMERGMFLSTDRILRRN